MVFSKKLPNIFITVVIFILSINLHVCQTVEYAQIEKLNPQQQKSLKDFKKSVLPILKQDWMKEDIYLVQLLEFNRFNVQKSQNHLKEILKWREDNKIDTIFKNPPEYFKEFEKDYPIYNDGYDKDGRLICEFAYGSWPVRKSALTGKIRFLSLYLLVNCMEKSAIKVREQQAAGKNVTQFIMLTNMDGFNLLEHGCPACMPFALSMATGVEKFYSGQTYGFWLINTPESFATMFRLLRPVLSAPTRSAIQFLTPNQAEWKPFLEKRVDSSQISDWYGGEKERKLS